ncbi:MAG: methionine synthase, partial [Planctomycetes bacterium]|nr:methionine synthase [Planctomycetota bacterium]
VAVFAVTAGAAVGEAARARIVAGDGAAALVYDATASESVEAAADWLDAFLCRRHGVPARGNHRFSPGYFDWPLAAQASIDRILDFSALGVALTPSFQLSPEKTVTAVKGV